MTSKQRKVLAIAVAAVGVETAATWLRSRRLGGRLMVQCRAGHRFETIWIPGVSLKALRLGPWRLQHCPVGAHWSLVTPVNETQLSEFERELGHSQRDLRIP
jgi:hypothetical protein